LGAEGKYERFPALIAAFAGHDIHWSTLARRYAQIDSICLVSSTPRHGGICPLALEDRAEEAVAIFGAQPPQIEADGPLGFSQRESQHR
jgi:hypothetical protein